MIWGIYDFDAMIVTFESSSSKELGSMLCPAMQCVVQRATTDEDKRYLGDKWQCMHCLVPESCTSCNPAYKHAYLSLCLRCNEHDTSPITWHLDGKCLHCKSQAIYIVGD